MKNLLLIVFSMWALNLSGQASSTEITLEEALMLAQTQSIDALIVKNRMRMSFWQYKNHKADLLPNINMTGTLPSFNRSYSSYQVEDGTFKYVSSNSVSASLSVSLTQRIPFTGGQIAIQSNTNRIEQLDGNKAINYMSVPVSISISQPLITANPLKWAMRIEPELYKQAKQRYGVEMEDIAIRTINYYFDLLNALTNVDIARQNLKNSEKLYEIALGKKNLGLISESDVLQLKLGNLNASSTLVKSQQNYEQCMFAFCNFLGLSDKVELIPKIPDERPFLEIPFVRILEMANRNNPFAHEVIVRQLSMEQQLAQIKAARGFQADIYASVGYTGSDHKLRGTYRNLQNRQAVSLGISIPILDWGKGKGKVELAHSQAEITSNQLKQDIINFEQTIQTIYRQYQEQSQVIEITRLADSVAQQRYKTAYETFLLGQINVLDINMAQVEKDNAKRNFLNQIYSSWLYFFTIRRLTLYDFEQEKDIVYDTLNF